MAEPDKGLLALVLKGKSKSAPPPEEMPGGGEEASAETVAAEEMMQAIRDDDPVGFGESMKAFLAACGYTPME